MDEFKIECYTGNNENIKLSEMAEKDFKLWQKELEVRAISEFYKRKIAILNDKN